MLLVFNSFISKTESLELPTFVPNEYFWKNHWDGKDPSQKWKVFANAVREAMAEVGGFKLSNSTMEDKMAYKELMWGKKDKDT